MNKNKERGKKPQSLSYETLLSVRSDLVESGSKQSASFDKHVLTLAAGVLSGTILFMERIAPSPVKWSLWLLYSSWGALAICITATLFSFLTAKEAFKKDVSVVDAEYLHQDSADARSQALRWKNQTRKLNWVSLSAFTIGLVLLGVFAGYNLWHKI